MNCFRKLYFTRACVSKLLRCSSLNSSCRASYSTSSTSRAPDSSYSGSVASISDCFSFRACFASRSARLCSVGSCSGE